MDSLSLELSANMEMTVHTDGSKEAGVEFDEDFSQFRDPSEPQVFSRLVDPKSSSKQSSDVHA